MRTGPIDDLVGILDRCREESGASLVQLSDRNGRVVARVGAPEGLPPEVRQYLAPDSLRRAALALDDEPQLTPDVGKTVRLHFSRAGRYVLALVLPAEVTLAEIGRHTSVTRSRVAALSDALRRERRRRFLAHRLITRVCDKTHVMSAEVRTMLERLCDIVLDLEDALQEGGETSDLTRQFRETLDELVAWPKGCGESFQRNLENLQDSVQDLGFSELTSERLRAITAGLEVTIESWPLP